MFAKWLAFNSPFPPMSKAVAVNPPAHSIRFVRNVIYIIEEVQVRFFHTLWHKFDSTILFTVTTMIA